MGLNYGIFKGFIQKLHGLPRASKKVLMVTADICLIPFALWLSLSLRLGELFLSFTSYQLFVFVAVIITTIPVFVRLGLYRAVMRYVGQSAIRQILIGVAFSSAVVFCLTLYNWPNGLPRSVFAIYGFVAFSMIGGTRLLARMIFGGRLESRGRSIAIYGAGASGRQLAGMLRAGHEYRPVLFIDDSAEIVNHEVEGIRVFSSNIAVLERQFRQFGVVAIFLAMPSESRSTRRKILQKLEALPVPIYTIPGLEEIVSGRASVNQLREVAIEDLLGRDPVPPSKALLSLYNTNHAVMVTGAGGSIGSELCRQLISLKPKCFVLYENSEYALYSIEQEVRSVQKKLGVQTEIISIMGSVCDKDRVERVIREYSVETIYHAAAYKHVPLVEHNPTAGIVNNVFGTQVMAEVAHRCGVGRFVFISTDKAVRPTNVMGASKRLGEMILQAYADQGGSTVFSMVRFGNVLGSSGSVVPQFRKQIATGGPITVTHPEINRFFMTIPEAVQLVIQAGAMAQGGDVFVLDMGEPVKICELARQMVHLSGLEVRDDANPDGDIEIVFTGLRPGEKLYEELLIGDNVTGTEHPKIMRAEEEKLSLSDLKKALSQLEITVNTYDIHKMRELLIQVVTGYVPQNSVLEKIRTHRERDLLSAGEFEQLGGYRH